MSKKFSMPAIALLLLLAFSFALLPSAFATDEELAVPNKDHMIQTSIGEPETDDPHWAYDSASLQMIFNVIDTLIFFDYELIPADPFAFQPRISDVWYIPDPTTYRFHIRADAEWHDFATYGYCTPEDVEYSIERGIVMDHAGGPMWMIIQPLLDAMTTRDWDLSDPTEALALVQAIDDAIVITDAAGNPDPNGEYVQFNLAIPYAPFMQIMAQPWGGVICKEYAINVAGTWDGVWPTTGAGAVTLFETYNDPELSPFDDPEHIMMGCGPYTFDIWEVGDYWRLKKYDDYYLGWPAAGCADYVSTATYRMISAWPTRRLIFLSDTADQCDLTYVPRANYPEIEQEAGVRGARDMPDLTGMSMHFNYDVATTALYRPQLGGGEKLDLLGDYDMRQALTHSLDFATYLADAWYNEAIQPNNPIIAGLAFYDPNDPMPSYDTSAMTTHFQNAWGGQVWSQGFQLHLLYNTGNDQRRIACEMIEYAIENEVAWPAGVSVNVIVTPRDWTYIIPAMYNAELGAWIIGWGADFPDPHNFIVPYMHTLGDFAQFQNVEYGQSGRMQMNWFGLFGDPTKVINNTYVNLLIDTGVKRTLGSERNAIYRELAQIWYEEALTLMLYQPTARMWERQWVQGRYFNAILFGPYYYHYWKGLDTDMTGREAGYKAYVDTKDVAKLNYYWWDGVIAGIGGYGRVADVWRPGRRDTPGGVGIKADMQEMDGGEYLYGDNPPITPTPSRGDGYVNIFDKARLNSEWHDYVLP